MRTFTFLGTGTSVGIPMLGCDCSVCLSPNLRNQRYRCSVLIRTDNGNILIDTSPELRLQLLREKVACVHAVLYTHYHADHLHGIDDLRPITKYLGGAVPLYCTGEVEGKIRTAFAYAFAPPESTGGYLPKLSFQRITEAPFEAVGQKITPIPLVHAWFNCFGFRIGDVAYCTDVSEIPQTSWPLLRDLDVLVIDALRYKPHEAHFSLDQALDVIAKVEPKKAYLTHISHDLDYDVVNSTLPAGVEMAYDGLTFPF